MCGRFALYSSGERIAETFLDAVLKVRPQYNVALTQTVPIVRAVEGG